MINHKLLNKLLKDEKKADNTYVSGPMWRNQNYKIAYQIRKNGLKNFRGIESGVGSGYCDNILHDIRNEINFKGRLVSKFFDLPLINIKTQTIVEKYIHESLSVLTNDTIRQEVLKMFNMPYPLNCFYQTQFKFKWVEILKEHFIKTNYDLGLKKCINKIDNIIN